MVELLIVGSNVLLVLVTMAACLLTMADIVKDENTTVRESLRLIAKLALGRVEDHKEERH